MAEPNSFYSSRLLPLTVSPRISYRPAASRAQIFLTASRGHAFLTASRGPGPGPGAFRPSARGPWALRPSVRRGPRAHGPQGYEQRSHEQRGHQQPRMFLEYRNNYSKINLKLLNVFTIICDYHEGSQITKYTIFRYI